MGEARPGHGARPWAGIRAMAAPPPLEIRCFGPPEVRVDGGPAPADVMWRKHLALLVYLALSPSRTRSRDHLLGLLWPDKDDRRARHSLNEAVRRLRQGLGRDRIRTDGDTVALDGTDLVVDATPGDLGEGRPFLEGLSLADAPAFDQWLEAERTRQAARMVESLVSAGERALTESRFEEARDLSLQAIQLDPGCEPAARLRMRAAALAGDGSGALRAYQDFARWLERELGESPSPELQDLAERIRAKRWRRRSAVVAVERDPPLVGRPALHAAAFQEVAAGLSEGPRVLGLGGITGSGKSRLVQECMSRWELEGGVCALARPLDSDRSQEWTVLRQLVRGGLGAAPGIRATSPRGLQALAVLAPDLMDHVPGLSPAPGDPVSALRDVLLAVAGERPLCLALDDAQWADTASLEAIAGALADLRDVPVLLIVTELEDAPEPAPALRRLQAEVGRHLPGTSLAFHPLAPPDVRELVNHLALWCEGEEQLERLSRRVYFESGGNPLFAVTLLHGLSQVASLREDALVWPPASVTLEAPIPMDIPMLVQSVMVARVGKLEPRTREVLTVAAAGGPLLHEDAIAAIAGLDPRAMEQELFELERRRFIQFDGERYRLRIPFLASVVRSAFLTPSQRHRIEQQYRELAGGESGQAV